LPQSSGNRQSTERQLDGIGEIALPLATEARPYPVILAMRPWPKPATVNDG
jgi:hypothetical protein